MSSKDHTSLRKDGRSSDELRPLQVEQGTLHRADGSARVVVGGTAVLCGVYGPTKLRVTRADSVSKAVVEASIRSQHAQTGPREADLAQSITSMLSGIVVLNDYPQCKVSVVLQVLADDGAVEATAINAAVLALIDAGVPILRLSAAVSIGWHRNAPIVDLLKSEEETIPADLTLVCSWGAVQEELKEGEAEDKKREAVAGGIDLMKMTGGVSPEHLGKLIAAGKEACRSVLAFFRLALKEKPGMK